MNSFVRIFTRNRSDDRGASMVEYGLLIALIVIVGMAAMGSVGSSTEENFEVIAAGFGEDGAVVGDTGEHGSTSTGEDEEEPAGGTDEESDTGDGGSINQAGDDSDDQGVPSGADDSGDSNGPGGSNGTGGSNDSGDNGTGGSNDSGDNGSDGSGGTGGDNDGSNGTGGDSGDEDPEPEAPTEPGSTVTLGSSNGTFYWWNGKDGGWKAVVTYENTWIRHQYLMLEVTRVDDKGKVTTSTIKDFYVPANGKSNLEVYDNLLSKSGVGTVSVTVKVTGIKTSDEAWKTVSYPGDGTTSTVKVPAIP